MAIAVEFVAYVDESGDEGYKFPTPPQRGSSEWFILSAVLHRPHATKAISDALTRYQTTSGRLQPFHFKKAYHEERVAFIKTASDLPLTAISILAHKPSLVGNNQAIQNKSHVLFRYTAKLLLERIAWYCAQNKRESGLVKIHFSDRGQLKLEALHKYLDVLQWYSHMEEEYDIDIGNHSIDWRYIKSPQIDVHPHNSLVGLQIADAVASGTAKAVEKSKFGLTEHRYVKLMRPIYWKRRGKCQSYSIKFFPRCPEDDTFAISNRFHWLRHFP